jgi:hypothetical protein
MRPHVRLLLLSLLLYAQALLIRGSRFDLYIQLKIIVSVNPFNLHGFLKVEFQ